jgi:hypothetical protein
MGSFSNYWEEKIRNHIFGKGNYAPPTIYVALSTADPLDNASGCIEPVGNAYSRVETSVSDWNTATDGSLDNANDILFPKATGSWGTITHFALFDSSTGGNMLAHGALNQPKAVDNSFITTFDAGDLNISLD